MKIEAPNKPDVFTLGQLMQGEVFTPLSNPDMVLMVTCTHDRAKLSRACVLLGCQGDQKGRAVGTVCPWISQTEVVKHVGATVVLP